MKMRLILIVSVFLFCSCGNEANKALDSIIDSTGSLIVVDSLKDDLTKFDTIKTDSLKTQLIIFQKEFLKCIINKDFNSAQQYIHENGIYFYTLGNIKKKDFSYNTLKSKKGLLDGRYAYSENPQKYVNGCFFIDSLISFTNIEPQISDGYHITAYGFTGNYSSNHIDLDGNSSPNSPIYFSKDNPFKVLYTSHNNHESDADVIFRDCLMVEFFPDKDGKWKIYSIGNLEWTP